jgi:hypothetical protein
VVEVTSDEQVMRCWRGRRGAPGRSEAPGAGRNDVRECPEGDLRAQAAVRGSVDGELREQKGVGEFPEGDLRARKGVREFPEGELREQKGVGEFPEGDLREQKDTGGFPEATCPAQKVARELPDDDPTDAAGPPGPTGSRGHARVAMVAPARMLMSYTETDAGFRRRAAAGGIQMFIRRFLISEFSPEKSFYSRCAAPSPVLET